MGKRRKRKATTHSEAEHTPVREHKKAEHTQKSDDDLSIDFSKAKDWINKLSPQTWLIIALLIIPIFLAGHFRAYPADLPITEEWAKSSVENVYKQQIAAGVSQQFPNLPAQNKQEMVDQQWEQFMAQNGDQLEQQIAGTSAEFKQRLKNDQGETYLLAIDPWTYYMEGANIIDHGHPGTELRDGKPFSTRTSAPLGGFVDANLHTYISLWTWNILKVFKPNMSLMGGVFWVPLIIACLAVIPAFFIVKRKAGVLGGFVAATLVAVHGAYLNRTPAGFSDTDAYNVFFPLLVAWLFLEAFETKDLRKKLLLSGGAGLALGIYSKIWVGWWYIFDFMIGAVVAYMAFVAIRYLIAQYQGKKQPAFLKSDAWKGIANTLMLSAVFIVVTGALITIFWDFKAFLSLPMQAISFSQLKVAAKPDLWPNVLTTVAELNEVNFAQVVGQMGKKYIFGAALLGLVASLLPKKKLIGKDYLMLGIALIFSLFLISKKALGYNVMTYLFLLGIPLAIGIILLLLDDRKVDIKYAVLILLWFIGSMYATTKGVRFTLVLVPAFAIAVGTLFGMLHKHLSQLLSKELELPKKIVVPALAIIICVPLLWPPIAAAHGVALHEVPSMNDAWYDSLTGIRNAGDEDAIITSWWDFGHWFKSIAQRAVTFDGGSQNTPMAHWVGKLLLTSDERESIGILRMLDCGSYTGFNTLNEYIDDTLVAKELMNKIVLLDKSEARAALAEAGLDATAQDSVLELTHCQPPQAFLITSSDMIGKSGVWGHFGSWNFERAYLYNVLRKKPQGEATQEMMDRFGYTQDQAQRTYIEMQGLLTDRAVNNWISPWPGYLSQWAGCTIQNASVNTSALGVNSTNEDILETRELAVCSLGISAGSQDGTDIRIEGAIIDLANPKITRLRYGFYRGGTKVGENDLGKPAVLVIAEEEVEDGLTTYAMEGATSGIGFLYDQEKHRILAADPLLIDSIFTQLYYLDGKYSQHYSKFSDKTSFNGQRVAIWNVDWQVEE